jgi:hypothetical protein
MTAVVELTEAYESWLGENIPLVRSDLAIKHAEMAESELRFLRGTYYYWLPRMVELMPELLERTVVPLVGDLHVENFGTWLDRRGVRRWGVNDFDELAWGAYPIDLVRLATSAVLTPGITLSRKEICALVLERWHLDKPARAIDVDGDTTAHLRRLVPPTRSPKRFWGALESAPAAVIDDVPAAVRAAAIRSVDAPWQPTWHERVAGTGSLGHPRVVAVGHDTAGAIHAREAKLLGPTTASWLPAGEHLPVVDDLLFGRVHTAIGGAYPSRRVAGWQIRRLAQDTVHIELTGLRPRDIERVVRSMAQAVVDVHGSDATAVRAARANSDGLGRNWLRDAVEVMAGDTRAAYDDWRCHMAKHAT